MYVGVNDNLPMEILPSTLLISNWEIPPINSVRFNCEDNMFPNEYQTIVLPPSSLLITWTFCNTCGPVPIITSTPSELNRFASFNCSALTVFESSTPQCIDTM